MSSTTVMVSSDTGYFAMTPEWVLDTASANAVKLYGLLRRYADKDNQVAHPSRRTLATRMGFSRSQSVDAPIRELVELGALAVVARHTPRGDQDSNEYHLRSVPPANIVRQDRDGIEMWTVTATPVRDSAQGGGASERTGDSAAERTTPGTADRTGGGALERTGSTPERTGGGAPERTTLVRETAHKPESPEPETSPADAGEVARKRAARIPEPFIVTRSMREWAAEEVPTVDVDVSTRMFVDHWRAASGSNAAKRDWTAAWRNWLRRDLAHSPSRPAGGGRENTIDRRNRQIAEMRTRLAAQEATRASGGIPAAAVNPFKAISA